MLTNVHLSEFLSLFLKEVNDSRKIIKSMLISLELINSAWSVQPDCQLGGGLRRSVTFGGRRVGGGQRRKGDYQTGGGALHPFGGGCG